MSEAIIYALLALLFIGFPKGKKSPVSGTYVCTSNDAYFFQNFIPIDCCGICPWCDQSLPDATSVYLELTVGLAAEGKEKSAEVGRRADLTDKVNSLDRLTDFCPERLSNAVDPEDLNV